MSVRQIATTPPAKPPEAIFGNQAIGRVAKEFRYNAQQSGQAVPAPQGSNSMYGGIRFREIIVARNQDDAIGVGRRLSGDFWRAQACLREDFLPLRRLLWNKPETSVFVSAQEPLYGSRAKHTKTVVKQVIWGGFRQVFGF